MRELAIDFFFFNVGEKKKSDRSGGLSRVSLLYRKEDLFLYLILVHHFCSDDASAAGWPAAVEGGVVAATSAAMVASAILRW